VIPARSREAIAAATDLFNQLDEEAEGEETEEG
jgi:hypothetical protein